MNINPNLLELLPHPIVVLDEYDIDPKQLISPYRIDVLAKLPYAEAIVRGHGSEAHAKKLYDAHLRQFNGFVEHDSRATAKVGQQAFDTAFRELIDSIISNGFVGGLPLSRDGIVIDGGHRVAAALACSIKSVRVARLDVDNPIFDYRFFRRRGLSELMLDELGRQYSDRVSKCVFGAVSRIKLRAFELIFSQCSVHIAHARVYDGGVVFVGEGELDDAKDVLEGFEFHASERVDLARELYGGMTRNDPGLLSCLYTEAQYGLLRMRYHSRADRLGYYLKKRYLRQREAIHRIYNSPSV